MAKQLKKQEAEPVEGNKSEVSCPKCDEKMHWWGYASSYTGDGSSVLGLGCENPKCRGYEIMPQDVADALDIEEERVNG